MPLEFHSDASNTVAVTVSGVLTKKDYDSFVPEMEQAIQKHGSLRLLFRMADFHGWEMGAAWEDLKFDMKHHADIQKLAMVGETRWEKWMAAICRPFTKAEVRYFPVEHLTEAEEWIRTG
ncbi:MAG: STAS/SEC14 domain-containing protein [Phycisphaerae bacterium]|nr:STAS/SEC14 domain-containing protein [Phycisphaerae bacterium]